MKTQLLTALLSAAGLAVQAADLRVCPPWQVTVVDENDRPVANCNVVQEWGWNYGGGVAFSSTNAVTDAGGQLNLPERYVASPPGKSSIKSVVKRLNSPDTTRPWNAITVIKAGYEPRRITAQASKDTVWTAEGIRTKVVLQKAKQGR